MERNCLLLKRKAQKSQTRGQGGAADNQASEWIGLTEEGELKLVKITTLKVIIIRGTGQPVPPMQKDQHEPDPQGYPCKTLDCSRGNPPPTTSQ